MEKNMINLGDKVKDTVSGYTGIAVSKTEYLHGCYRIGVQSQKLKDGATIAQEAFDEPQLVVVGKSAVKQGLQETGGPRPGPAPRSNPRR